MVLSEVNWENLIAQITKLVVDETGRFTCVRVALKPFLIKVPKHKEGFVFLLRGCNVGRLVNAGRKAVDA